MPAAAQTDMIPGQLHSLFRKRCHAYASTLAEMQKQTDGLGEKGTRAWSS